LVFLDLYNMCQLQEQVGRGEKGHEGGH